MRKVEILTNYGINVENSLEVLGDMETYDEIVEEFLSGIDEKMKKFEQFLKEKKSYDYAILVHGLKSEAKYLGFTELAKISFAQELKAKADDIEYINNNISLLFAEIKKIVEVLNNYLNS